MDDAALCAAVFVRVVADVVVVSGAPATADAEASPAAVTVGGPTCGATWSGGAEATGGAAETVVAGGDVVVVERPGRRAAFGVRMCRAVVVCSGAGVRSGRSWVEAGERISADASD